MRPEHSAGKQHATNDKAEFLPSCEAAFDDGLVLLLCRRKGWVNGHRSPSAQRKGMIAPVFGVAPNVVWPRL